MGVSNQNINPVPSSPGLRDVLNYLKKEIKLEFNCHHIGTIVSFNAALQTARATINYTRTFMQNVNGVQTTATANYPVLTDCPVICLGGGGGSLTFPILPGDECVVLFNDRDIDFWVAGSSSSPPNTARLHSFADAVVLVGVRSRPNILLDYDTDAVALRYLGNTIKIYLDKVLVELVTGVSLELDATGKLKITNLTGEFVSSIIQLFSDIQSAVTNTLIGPQPLVMPTFAVDLLKLQSFEG